MSTRPAVIAELVNAGANLEAKGAKGWTPLHTAAMYNDNPAIVAALIDGDADLEARAEGGWTPLHLAAGNRNPEVIRTIILAGANLAAASEEGMTAHRIPAAARNENPAVVGKRFWTAGANLEAQSEWGTPLHMAAMWSQIPAVVPMLLDAGANREAAVQTGSLGHASGCA